MLTWIQVDTIQQQPPAGPLMLQPQMHMLRAQLETAQLMAARRSTADAGVDTAQRQPDTIQQQPPARP